MGKLKIVVLYDRVLVDEADEGGGPSEKSPIVRTLDKKEVEEEVSEALVKLGHDPVLYELDGTLKSLFGLAKVECDLVFNLAESFADDDTADFKIAGFLELLGRRYTGTGTHGLMLAQDKAVAKKIFAFHGIHTPVFAKSFRGRLDFSHDLHFPVIVKPAREDGSIGIEFSAVVSSIKELMERMDWLHAHFDSPVLIEEYIEGREMYVGVLGNDKPEALPVIELDLSKLPEGTPRIAAAEVKWGKGTKAYRDTKSAVATDLPEEALTALAADRGGGVPGAGTARLRARRHAAAAGRAGAGHRGESQPMAEFASGVRDGGPQVGPDLPATGRRDHRSGNSEGVARQKCGHASSRRHRVANLPA